MNRIDLAGRVAVITGGAQGIGYAAAQRFLRSGASVVLWDIDAARVQQAVRELGELAKGEGLAGKVGSAIVELSEAADVDDLDRYALRHRKVGQPRPGETGLGNEEPLVG